MNDIKRGIFEIDGIEINRDTKVKNVSTNKMNVWVSDKFEGNARVNSLSNKLSFLGEQCFVEYVFSDYCLDYVEINPDVEDIQSPGYPDLEYQRKIWEYECEMLKKAFGIPDEEDESYISYKFEKGTICCYQILNGRNEGEGGKIKIEYEQW